MAAPATQITDTTEHWICKFKGILFSSPRKRYGCLTLPLGTAAFAQLNVSSIMHHVEI